MAWIAIVRLLTHNDGDNSISAGYEPRQYTRSKILSYAPETWLSVTPRKRSCKSVDGEMLDAQSREATRMCAGRRSETISATWLISPRSRISEGTEEAGAPITPTIR